MLRRLLKTLIVLPLIFWAASVSSQVTDNAKTYTISKPVLRAGDPFTVKFVLEPSGYSEEYDPDYVEFGVYGTHDEDDDYGYHAADPNWESYSDQNENYEAGNYGRDGDPNWQNYQSYVGNLKVSFTQPRPKPPSAGHIRAEYETPKYLSPFGRSYTARVIGAGRKASGSSVIDDTIKYGNSVGHILLFGPEPEATVETATTNLPGQVFDVKVGAANQLVKNYGDQCSLNLFHAGRVHIGGAIEGDWLIDRVVITEGQSNYSLDPKSVIRNRLPFEKAYDSFIGPHLVELWCWGVLVDQKEVQVNLPADIELGVSIDERPSEPSDLKLAFYYAPIKNTGPGAPPQYLLNTPVSENDRRIDLPLGEPDPNAADENTPNESPDFQPLDTPSFDTLPLERIDILEYEPLPVQPSGSTNNPGELADLLESQLKSEYFSGDRGAIQEQITNLRERAENGETSVFSPEDLDVFLADLEGLGEFEPDLSADAYIGEEVDNKVEEATFTEPKDKPALYKVAVSIDGLTPKMVKALKENLTLYALPPKLDVSQIQDVSDYPLHYFFDETAPNQNSTKLVFWIQPGRFNLKLAWHGDIGARRRITLAEKDIIIVAANDDTSALHSNAGEQSPTIFTYGDLDVQMVGVPATVYPNTQRQFTLTSKTDFSNHELFYQLRRKEGFLHGCQAYEWIANEDGDSHYVSFGKGGSMLPYISISAGSSLASVSVERDNPRFNDLEYGHVSGLLQKNGDNVTIRQLMPKYSGNYELLIFVAQKTAEPVDILNPGSGLVVGKYNFMVTHPAANLTLPNGNTFGAEELSLAAQPNLPTKAAYGEYNILAYGLDGYLREKRGLDPSLSGRRGLRADHFDLKQEDFSPERYTRLAKAGSSAAYYQKNIIASSKNKNGTSTIIDNRPIDILVRSLFNDVFITNSLGYELARQRVYWKPFNSQAYIDKFYFAKKYPFSILPFEPDKSGWIKPDDRLRKRAVWDPNSEECAVPIAAIADKGAPGASDGAIP